MRTISRTMLATLLLAGMMPFSLQADYLKNTDLKGGLAGWHGEGVAAFFNPGGAEAREGDKGVIPVIKIALSKSQPHSVYQEYETRDNPKTQHIQVEVYASNDFKRSTFASDYSREINWKPGGV